MVPQRNGLSRLISSIWTRAPQPARRKERMRFEPMEPRLLLSADAVLPGLTSAVTSGLLDFADSFQAHMEDAGSGYDERVPGIVLTNRDTDGNGELNDQDLTAPQFRDLLMVEFDQFASAPESNLTGFDTPREVYQELESVQAVAPHGFDALRNQEHVLGVLDTDEDGLVSWKEAFTGIVIGGIADVLAEFDADLDNNGVLDRDLDDVEAAVAGRLASLSIAYPGEIYLGGLIPLFISNVNFDANERFDVEFTTRLRFQDRYQIDLGLEADAAEIELAQWVFDFGGSTPDVDEQDRSVGVLGEVIVPLAISTPAGAASVTDSDVSFTATGAIQARVSIDEALDGQRVNIGFLGTVASDTGSEDSRFILDMAIETRLTDPSSPTRLGFADTDGDNTLAERLAFVAQTTDGTLEASAAVGDAAFDLATPILFDLQWGSVPATVPISVNVSAAGTAGEVAAALNSALNGSSLNGLVSAAESGGVLSLSITDGNLDVYGFSDGPLTADGGGPFSLTAASGFDFDTATDNEISFAQVTFLISLGANLPRVVTVAAGSYTRAEWRSAVESAIDEEFDDADFTVFIDGPDEDAKLRISSSQVFDVNNKTLTMTAANAISASEINTLNDTAAERARIYGSTPDTADDEFSITMHLKVVEGLDFTPAGAPTLVINAEDAGGPFGLDDDPGLADPELREDFAGNPRFALAIDDIAGNDLQQYLDFNVFGEAETIAMLQQLEGWMDRLEQNVALSGVDIPLADGVLGQALDFSDLLHDMFLSDDLDNDDEDDDVGKLLQIVADLNADDASIIFFTAQEFGAALDELGILELTASGDYATYDAASKDILYHVDAVHEIADIELPVDFSLPLPPLGAIYSESSLFLTAEGTFEAILGLRMGDAGSIDGDTELDTLNNGQGVEVAAGPAITAAAAVARVEGRLLADAHFTAFINGTPHVFEILAADTSTNEHTSDLLHDIQLELDAQLDDGVLTAVQDGDRIRLVAGPTVNTLSFSVSTLDTAFTQLGLQSGPASTVSWTSEPIASVSAGNGGVLTIDIFGDTPAADLTINNAAANLSVTDLVNDINARIAADTTLSGKILASRLGDRIVFSAVDKSIYGFSVSGDTTAQAFFNDDVSVGQNAWLEVTAPNEPDPDTLAPYGRLAHTLALEVNGETITLTSAETESNGSLADFVDDLNFKLGANATLGGKVLAEVSGTRILLRANDATVEALGVSVAGSDAGGAAEMGFGSAALVGGQLGATGNRAAPFYYGPTGDASFQVALTGFTGEGPTSVPVTVSYLNSLGSAADLLTNATVFDFATDVQRALNAAFGGADNNPLLVGVDSGRLLFTVKAGADGHGVTHFQISADPGSPAGERAVDELKLFDVNDADPLSGVALVGADSADLLIQDRSGKFHRVELDGETTVGGVIAAINDQTKVAGITQVLAAIGPLGNGLMLTDQTGETQNALVVRTVNGSNAAVDLGIYLGGVSAADQTSADTIPDSAGVIIGDTIGTLALIDRLFVRHVDGDTPILSASLEIGSDDPDTGDAEEISLEANFGFVAVTAHGGGTLTGSVGVGLHDDPDGRVTLRDLYSAVATDLNGDTSIDLDDFSEVLQLPAFDLSGQFDLDVDVVPGGGVEAVIGNASVGSLSVVIDNPGDIQVEWTGGDLGDLEQFSNIDFDDVLNGLKLLADFLDDYAAFDFLNQEIPLIGVDFNELVDLAQRFRSAVVEIEQNPAGSVQLLEQKIREEFGLPPGVLTLALADGDDGDSAAGDMLKIKFNLGGGFSESLPIAFGIPDDLIADAPIDISLEGQADLNATGNLTALFTIGVDLNPGSGFAPVYLYTNESETKIEGSLSASANDLTFNAALGPVGVTIADGGASLALAVSFKSDDAAGTRVALGSAFSSFDQVSFSGSANAVLPVYFPTQSSHVGDISLEAEFHGSVAEGLEVTMFDVEVPTDFEIDFESFSLFDNLGLLIDATDLLLSGVQDILDGQVLGFDLPLVGDELAGAAQFIEEFRAGFITDLRNLVENAPSLAATTVQGFLFDLLGDEGGLDLLADTDGDGDIDLDDVVIEGLDSLEDAELGNDYLQWNVLLGKHIPLADVNIDFDLGFPALGLDGDIAFDVALTWELGIGMGISIADGAYIDVRRQDYTTEDDDELDELVLTFDVTLADETNLSGDLLFLQLDINEAPRDLNGDSIADPTHFHAQFGVDLTGGDAEGRLAFSELGSLGFELDLDADAAVNLDLTLKMNEDLVPSDSGLAAILPQINAHFALYWEVTDLLSGDVDLGAGLKYVAFEDVELDLGSFLGDLIVPLVEKIQNVTEPFQPIIDVVTAAIPVLSDLAGEPVTLVDIAAAFGEFNPDLIYALADLISLVNSIPTDVDSLIIEIGDFVIFDEGGSSFGGVSASQLADKNFSFRGDEFDGAFGGLSGLPGIGDLIDAAEAFGGATGGALSGLLGGDFNTEGGDGEDYGFKFDLFEDPSQIFGLLLGRPADIVTYDLPPFMMDFSWKQSFPIYGPLWGVVTASVGLEIDLEFGYDTQGLSDFFDSGFQNPLALLSGLFISDVDDEGVDVPELVFTGSIGVGAELNAGIASAGATVNIILTVNFDLYDPDDDGKIRINELVSTFMYEIRSGDPALAPLAIFDIDGEISLQLKAYIEFLFARFDFDITPPITLFEFSIPFEREPFLATERDDGSLLLNIGANAAARMNGDIRDLSEEITVEYIGNNQARVWSSSLGVDEDAAQVYDVDPTKGVFAYGGEGNDVILVKGQNIKLTAEGGTGDDTIVVDSSGNADLRGGVGNDTLVGGSGADLIFGELGDDTIDGRDGVDWIFGDIGLITTGATGSVRAVAGSKDGNDIIWGGAGADVVMGGGGHDSIAGDGGALTGIADPANFSKDGVTIDFGAAAVTDGAADFLFGDGGRIDAKGAGPGAAPDNGVLALERTTVDLRATFAGITLTDRTGGGNDLIEGQGAADVIFAGSGDDRADGGVDDDVIFGETGLDVLSGGADDDEVSGGLGKDFIFGFGEGPGDPYNDGGSLETDGDDLLFGDNGNDLIRGNGGDDDIHGDRGADVLFGDAGEDDIFGGNEGDVIFGGAGDDDVEGGTGNDTVFGDDGLVIYFAGTEDDATDDRVIGDADAALAFYYDATGQAPGLDDDADLTLDLMITEVNGVTDGDDTVIGGEGDDIVFGGAGDDILYGDLDPVKWLADYAGVAPPPVPAGSDTLIGDGGKIEWFGRRIDRVESFAGVDETEAGDDTLSGNGGTDRLFGGGGSDWLYGRMPAEFAGEAKLDEDVGIDPGDEISDNDIALGDDGEIDFVRGSLGTLVRIATTVYDPLTDETYADHLFGNWGRDILLGGLGGDEMQGDTGLQFSEPRSTDDIMLGDNGELLYAGNTVPGNLGRLEMIRTTDIVNTTGGADTMSGQEGDDVVIGGVNGSVDVLFGNVGDDVMLGDNGELDFALDLDTDLDTLDLIRSYRDGLGGIDQVSGSAGNDVLIGGTAGDEMYGDDAAASAGAADGEDIMLGDNADIFLVGTSGRLKVRVADMMTGTAVDLIKTTDTDEGTGGADTMSGNAQADVMLGGVNNGGQDVMYGDSDAPTMTSIGADADDILLGDNGELDFTFDGDSDRNTLDLIRSHEDGMGGVDVVSGNKGADVAIGGTAGDQIYGDDLAASAAASDGSDMLLGDNADVFLVARGMAAGADLKVVLDAAVMTIRTTDEENPAFGGSDTISGNAEGDIIAGGVQGDTLYGDALSVVPGLDGDDVILGDNGAFEWLSTGRLSDIGDGIDIEENNPALWAKYGGGVAADADLGTLDLITTEQPNSGGRDTIFGDEGSDLAFGGTDLDLIHGDDGDEAAETDFANADVLFGDHGRLYPQFSALDDFNSRNFFAIDTGDLDGGEGDVMYGEEGDDVMLGQQGDDRMWGGSEADDMIGGHNVAGGIEELTGPAVNVTSGAVGYNDLMDGGSGNDAMKGDNVIVWRRGDDLNPRFRLLTEDTLYTTTADTITANVGTLAQSDPNDTVGRDIEVLDHADDVEADPDGRFGDDLMAGGADDDLMLGDLGDDIMQGDGSISTLADGGPNTITLDVDDAGGPPDTDGTLYFNVPEDADTDGDDYMEGSGGDDLMYGGLGQDDMIGGSSSLFGLVTQEMRPDGSDTIFGGAGIDTDRNHAGDAAEDGTTHVITTVDDGHALDADFIMGDNANVYRPVNDVDQFLSFSYDDGYAGNLRIVPRVMQQLDYTLGGADYAGGSYENGVANDDNGLADLIHGESGDDYIFGMTGSDVIFGEGQNDDIVGGYGHDWISGGTGQDGVLGDDGLLYTRRNSSAFGEALYGLAPLLASDPDTRFSHGNVLNELIATPGDIQIALINPADKLAKVADFAPLSMDPGWVANDDEFPDNTDASPFADDIIFGGLGSDWLHGGSGDDAISGAEALAEAYVPVYDASGNPVDTLDLGYDAVSLQNQNPGDVLAFNDQDLDGQHLNNRFRAGEFPLYDEYDPLRKVQLTATGALWKPEMGGMGQEFLLNFDEDEGVLQPGGVVPKATGQQTGEYGPVNDDGNDVIFGDTGNDWLVGGTGRDTAYGGWGNDLMNVDDDLTTLGDGPKHGDPEVIGANDRPDTHPTYEDRAYGGAGRDVLIANTGGDRLIDWVGEYNSFLVPFAPFGQATVSRTLMPHLHEFLYALSESQGADPTRPADTGADALRNGEPEGEMGLVLQKDFAWQDQTGAPADPQAGNIPGGKRDVLRSSGMNDGSMDGFFVDTGKFAVENGVLKVAADSTYGDAVSVYHVGDALPGYFEVQASVSAAKPTGGWKANSYVIFDYVDETDFKFAGIDASSNKLVIGHKASWGWAVDRHAPIQAKPDTVYNLLVAVNGVNVTVLVDNKVSVTHTFQPRMVDGFAQGLNYGLLGVGSDSSRGTFDNIAVLVVPPATTFQHTEDFAGGVAQLLPAHAADGNWQIADGRYTATGMATSLMDLGIGGLQLNSVLDLSAKLNTQGRAGFVFDRYADDDFKFVAIDAATDQVIIGHYQNGWTIDAAVSRPIDAGVDYTLGISLLGSKVSVSLNGQAVTSKVYNAVVVDGEFGLLAVQGAASFDDVKVRTNDPAFVATQGSNLLADGMGTGVSDSRPTQAELDTVTASAAQYWTATLGAGDERLAGLGSFSIGLADLEGEALGYAEGRRILIDADAAGHGWSLPSDGDAFGRMDLLTVVTHELGHVLGLEDYESGFAVMQGELQAQAARPAPAEPSFDLGVGTTSAASLDWQPNALGSWTPAYSPFDTSREATASANFADYLLKLGSPASYDALGAALLKSGKKAPAKGLL